MLFRNLSTICLMFWLLTAFASVGAAQRPENLAARLVAGKNIDEQRRLLENRTSAELKEIFNALIEQSNSPALSANFAERVRLLKLAGETAEKTKDQIMIARAATALGNAHLQTNFPQPAFEFYQQAFNIYDHANELGLKSELLSTIAFIYRNQADYDKTLEYYDQALTIAEKLDNQEGISFILEGIGSVNMLRGDYAAADRAHNRGLDIARRAKLARSIASAIFHLAIVQRLRGNYTDALRLYHQARQLSETIVITEPGHRGALSTNLRHIGGTYFLQGNLRLANDYANQSLLIDEADKNREAIAYSHQFLARVRFAEKNYSESQKLAEQVLPIFEELSMKEPIAGTLAILGITHAAQGNHRIALDYFERALKIREETKSRDGAAFARIHMANVLNSQGKHHKAIELSGLAAESARTNGNRELLWQAQSATANAHAALVDCQVARQEFDEAIATIEGLRGEVVGGAGESSLFFAEKVRPYQQLAQMLAGQNDFPLAFEYAERAKARVLLDSLRFGRNQPTANMTAAEKTEEQSLRGELVSLNAQISKLSASRTADKKRLPDLETRRDTARAAFQRFQTNLYAAHPELKARRGATEPIKTPEVAGLLDEKTALLEFLVTDDQALLFVFVKNANKVELKTFQIKIRRADLTNKIQDFRQKIAASNLLFAGDARALYDLFIAPAAAQLKGKTKLVIVPDDGLWELPFQAVQSAENRYLFDDYAISYAPSLTILRELRTNISAANQTNNILALGNPLDGRAGVKVNFAALPEAERQTAWLKNLYGASRSLIFTRGAATEAVFKREAAKFSTLHLATHGVLDNQSPLNSYVLLTPGASGDDGRLEAWELLEMNLRAELVVLSACETARGQTRSGEGIVGLAWSLMVAGARNVIVSQWKVESASTTDLTVEFYKSLGETAAPDKAEALRQAALKLRRNPNYSHPFYWAGFVLVGNGK